MEQMLTTIQIQESTRDRLKHMKRGDETYDDFLKRLMDLEEQVNKNDR